MSNKEQITLCNVEVIDFTVKLKVEKAKEDNEQWLIDNPETCQNIGHKTQNKDLQSD